MQHERSVAAASLISVEDIIQVDFRKSIAGGVVGSPHAAKQRPDKFQHAISGSTSDTIGAAIPHTAPLGVLGARFDSSRNLRHVLRDSAFQFHWHQHPVTALAASRPS
jgi:hypothetical protein